MQIRKRSEGAPQGRKPTAMEIQPDVKIKARLGEEARVGVAHQAGRSGRRESGVGWGWVGGVVVLRL